MLESILREVVRPENVRVKNISLLNMETENHVSHVSTHPTFQTMKDTGSNAAKFEQN